MSSIELRKYNNKLLHGFLLFTVLSTVAGAKIYMIYQFTFLLSSM